MKVFKSEVQEIKVSYQTSGIRKVKITSSSDAEQVFRPLFPVDIEHREAFTILLLNRAHNTIGHFIVSTGGISGTVADVRLVFQVALKCNATSLLICHNHPSGNLYPSEVDKKLTKRMVDAGNLLEIPVLDHLILTPDSYFSFADDGILV